MGQQFDWEALLATLTLPAPTSHLFRLFYVIQGALATETLGEAGQTLGAGDALLLPATIAWAAANLPASLLRQSPATTLIAVAALLSHETT